MIAGYPRMKVREISTTAEIEDLERAIVSSAEATSNAVRRMLAEATGIQFLAQLKFQKTGRDPISERPLNFIEQVNQTFTYLASCDALRYLFAHHPERAPFIVHLGTAAGPDIVSLDGALVAEVFAATRPDSNGKLRKDVQRLRARSAVAVRYLFYSCPGESGLRVSNLDSDVTVVSLGLWRSRRVGSLETLESRPETPFHPTQVISPPRD
jgi:hypothetical protein